MNFWWHKLIIKVNKYKNNDMENFISNRYWEKTENIKICGRTSKLEVRKTAICLRFLPHLQKI